MYLEVFKHCLIPKQRLSILADLIGRVPASAYSPTAMTDHEQKIR